MSFVTSAEEDVAFVQRCLRGEAEAFRPLVERYQRVLFTVALRMLGDRDEADDAAQNAFVHAYQKLGTWDQQHKFFSWLYRILVNECLNARRARRPMEPIAATIVSAEDPSQQVLRRELRERVHAALQQLTPPLREAVVLRHWADMSYRDMAETLGVPEKTVKSRLFSARQRLGELLLR